MIKDEVFEQLFNSIGQTYYEREHNITITGKEIIIDTYDFKVVKIGKSTGEYGICLFYKPSTRSNSWSFWYPSKNQQEHLETAGKILKEIDGPNSKFWVIKNEST